MAFRERLWETYTARLGNRPLQELLTSPPKGLWHEIAADHLIFEAIARPLEIGPSNDEPPDLLNLSHLLAKVLHEAARRDAREL
jgi:hypothetical protein